MALNKDEVLEILNKKKIKYELVEHRAVYTIDDMLECGLPHQEQIAKNLFVRDDKKQKYYLITCLEDKKVNLKEFRNANNTRPLSFASETDLADKLGLYPGAVTPLGILNNDNKDVIVYMDKDFENKLMGVHPCDNTATVFMSCRDVSKLIKDHGNELHFVKL